MYRPVFIRSCMIGQIVNLGRYPSEDLDTTPARAVFRRAESLHRVSPVAGNTPRAILTMSFDSEPGVMCSAGIRRRYSGRTH
jgi:hypothetical protein